MRTTIFMACLAVGAVQSREALAKEQAKPNESKSEEADDFEDEEKEDLGPWKVKVRPELRGLKLRIDDKVIPLDDDEITLKGTEDRKVIELSENGRLQQTRKVRVDKWLLDDLAPRSWRVGISTGFAEVRQKAFEDLMMEGVLMELAINAAWQPTALGLETEVNWQSGADFHGDIDTYFSSTQTRLSALYTFAPFANGGRAARRFQVQLRAGGFQANNRASISDDEVTLSDQSSNPGLHGGFDLMLNARRFWFMLRTTVTHQTIKFEDLDYESEVVQGSIQFGGNYAF